MKRFILNLAVFLGALALAKRFLTTTTKPKTDGLKLLSELWARIYNPPYDLDTIDRLCTVDVILSNPDKDVVGRAAFKEWARAFNDKIRDMRLTNLDMFMSEDGTRVVSRWKVTGFNRGVLGTPADDQPIEFTGTAVWEIRDGKLAHNWVERSAYELWQRLQSSPR
jgi:predicted ester cyclase